MDDFLRSVGPLSDFIGSRGLLNESPLSFLDIGCSGGSPEAFRLLGSGQFRVVGVDPNIREIERLSNAEVDPSVEYLAAYVGLPASDPFMAAREGRDWASDNPWDRLSASWAGEILATGEKSTDRLTRLNFWSRTELADPKEIVGIDELVAQTGLQPLDFLKVDVDGADFAALKSGQATLAEPTTLGVCVEVSFYGSADPTENSFHNTDRFLRECGFTLFNLTTNRYSAAVLPAPFLYRIPAQTVSGRLYQGDALYLRDLAAPGQEDVADEMTIESLIKLSVLFDLFDLSDWSLDLLVKFRERFADKIDVDEALNAVTRARYSEWSTYDSYMARFAGDPRALFPEDQ